MSKKNGTNGNGAVAEAQAPSSKSVIRTEAEGAMRRVMARSGYSGTVDLEFKSVKIQIQPIKWAYCQLRLVGDSDLLCHRFDKKSQRQMEDVKEGKVNVRTPKDPVADYEASLYPLPGRKGEFGFPAGAFRTALVDAMTYFDGMPGISKAYGALFIETPEGCGHLVPIESKKGPHMDARMCRIGKFPNKVADMRYRGAFTDWAVTLLIRYDADVFTFEQIANMAQRAGGSLGVGEFRPQKKGDLGLWHLDGVAVPTSK